jgi:hypothetical protein
MNSYIYFLGINQADFTRIIKESSQPVADFFSKTEEYLLNDKDCLFLLSKEEEWDNNHDEILKKIRVISPFLSKLLSCGTTAEILIRFNMEEYQKRNLTTFIFLNTFSKLLSEFRIKLRVTLIMPNSY